MSNHAELLAMIERAAHEGDFGDNYRRTPSAAMCEAGNYKKGRLRLYGLPLTIEQPRNSIRRKENKKTGEKWESRMGAHYGDIEGTCGADDDPVDVFIGTWPLADTAYVINQYVGGTFDEHKVMLAFHDEADARSAYLASYERGWPGLESLIPVSISQLKWWLKHGDMSKPLTTQNLPHEGQTMQRIFWNSQAQPVGQTLDRVLYDVRRDDAADQLLLDACTKADILDDSEGVMVLDALVVPFARLPRQMELLKTVMERTPGEVKPLGLQITEPFKQRGVANVAAIFELSDGQTLSIFFHNPDVNPKKIGPGDELVSWKWLLNKKDVTIVVAPERGVDLNVREVARRILKLAEKNSAAFARANTNRAARMQNITSLKDEVAALESELTTAQHELEVAQQEALDHQAAKDKAEATVSIEEVADAMNKTRGSSVWWSDATINQILHQAVAQGWVRRPSTTQVEWTNKGIDAYQSWRNSPPVISEEGLTPEKYASLLSDKEELAKWQGVIDMVLTDRFKAVIRALLAMGWEGDQAGSARKEWIAVSTSSRVIGDGNNMVALSYSFSIPGSKPDSDFILRDTLQDTPQQMADKIDAKATALLQRAAEPTLTDAAKAAVEAALSELGATRKEWSVGANPEYQFLMANYEGNGVMLRVDQYGGVQASALIAMPDGSKEGHDSPVVASDPVQIAQAIKDMFATPVRPVAASLTGSELGEYPDTPEGKKELRAAAKALLMGMRGNVVPCPAIGRGVEIRRRSIKETLAFSADPRKLKLIPAIKEMIGSASLESREDNHKPDLHPGVVAYYHLKNTVSLEGAELRVRVVIAEAEDGTLYYDFIINRDEASETTTALDSAGAVDVSVGGSNHNSEIADPLNVGQQGELVNVFDSTDGTMVFNLFIEEEEPEALEEEPEDPQKPASQQDVLDAIKTVRPFLSKSQLSVMGTATRGEEGQWFKDKFVELAELIKTMPRTYGQDGKGDQAVAYMHYFTGNTDHWITELDMEGDGTEQAFGLAKIHETELGYISIDELVAAGAELDLHWTPKTLAQIKGIEGDQGGEPVPFHKMTPEQQRAAMAAEKESVTDEQVDAFLKTWSDLAVQYGTVGYRVAGQVVGGGAFYSVYGGGIEVVTADGSELSDAGAEQVAELRDAIRGGQVQVSVFNRWRDGVDSTKPVQTLHSASGSFKSFEGVFELPSTGDLSNTEGTQPAPGAETFEPQPVVEPAPTPETVPEPSLVVDPAPVIEPAPQEDAYAADRAFFQSVIDGTAPDMLAPDLADKLEQAYYRVQGQADLEAMFEQAVNAYTAAAMKATDNMVAA